MPALQRLLFLAFLFIFTSLHSQEIRVEPMHWWAGMKNTQLQLLVHAADIGEASPSLQYPGVAIRKVHRADSKNYLFIDLTVSPQAKPGQFVIRFTKQGKVIHTYNYQLKQRKKDRANLAGFTASDAIYLITPDRFANGDESNDVDSTLREKSINRKNDYGRHGGDLRGMINQLDYIASMGFTAIWPTPVLENDMSNSSYHGYAITDHYKVDPRFGTMEEYIELADKARAKGIKLIFDGVLNHTGLQYWWMKDLPFANWINYADSMKNTNHRRTVNQDPYASATDRELMVKGWFVRQMPDLNQENPFLGTYLIQNNIWWIETLGLGGIRQDTYPYSEKKFLAQWSCAILKEYPFFSIMGEEWSTNPLVTSYWQVNKANNSGYKGCLKSPMDFPLQSALVQALTEKESWDKGLVKIYEALANDFVYAQPKDLLVFGDNHDMDRIFTQLKKDPALLKMALGYLLTIRGIPQLYYGTEILMENSAKPNDHGLIRSDFPGGWNGDPVNGFTGSGLTEEQLQVKAYLKKLLNWRKTATVIHNGNTLHFAPDNGVYVYFRYDKTKTVMIVLNKNAKEVQLSPSKYSEILKGKKTAVDIITETSAPLDSPLTIAANSIWIAEIK